ncbi:PD-(D/E)XK motif protein [uncultured Cellulomonas sp.]|uniref:PD-(D/E)XK motif protein n=1 Tax=uncultured Cellulomonas sp. TaxID=189682 RepID=UPI0028E30E96|nr:PD-(D/E)XK motif protein [uncultured Cellulomonas sp.]
MSTTLARLNSAWGVLERPTGTSFNTFPLSVDGGPDIRAAIDQDGFRHLLIAGSEQSEIERSFGVLSVDYGPLIFSGVTRSYLDICCTEPTLNVEFQEVASDILDAVDGNVEPMTEALVVIDRWRRLLRASGLGSMRENERIGLFAELRTLIALNSRGNAVPASAWTGPLRQPHDFELADRCLEVKALGADSASIRVHGIEQLDRHDGRPLDLLLATVVPDPEGETIPDLVTKLGGLVEKNELFERLNRARVNLADPVLTSSPYTMVSLFIVHVTSGTPRLVAETLVGSALPVGVGRVNYEVEVGELLAAARPVSLGDPLSWWTE